MDQSTPKPGLYVTALYGNDRSELFVKDTKDKDEGICDQPVRVIISKPAEKPKRTTLSVLLMGFEAPQRKELRTTIETFYHERSIKPTFQECDTLDQTRAALHTGVYDYLIAEPGKGERDGYTAAWIAPGVAQKYNKPAPYTIIYGNSLNERRAVDANNTAVSPAGLERVLGECENARYGTSSPLGRVEQSEMRSYETADEEYANLF